MTLYEHRRLLAIRRGELGRERRIVKGVGSLPGSGREGDRLRDRDITTDVIAKLGRATNHPAPSAAQVQLDQRKQLGGRAADKLGPSRGGAELRDVGEFGRDDLETLCSWVYTAKAQTSSWTKQQTRRSADSKA
jgi:hypothetical protein